MKESFYLKVWTHTSSAIEEFCKFHSETLKNAVTNNFRFYIFNGDLEDGKSMIGCESFADAVTKMLSIIQDKSQFRVYHVSLWQLHGDGTFHCVGYSEDKTARAVIEKLEDLQRNSIWRYADIELSKRIHNEMCA
jgi:hypothetical protein